MQYLNKRNTIFPYRRSGNIEQGGDIIKLAIENCRGRETRDFWINKYIGYLQYSAKEIDVARKFLNEQIERNPVWLLVM